MQEKILQLIGGVLIFCVLLALLIILPLWGLLQTAILDTIGTVLVFIIIGCVFVLLIWGTVIVIYNWVRWW